MDRVRSQFIQIIRVLLILGILDISSVYLELYVMFTCTIREPKKGIVHILIYGSMR